jgi:hypothetical protein
MITKIESTKGAIAPMSLIKYRLLNHIKMIKIASIILMKERNLTSLLSTKTLTKTATLQMMMQKSVMLQILYKASFPNVWVYMKNTKQLMRFNKKLEMLKMVANLRAAS